MTGYEPKHAAHCDAAVALGATLYVASVAKSAGGIANADAHLPSSGEGALLLDTATNETVAIGL